MLIWGYPRTAHDFNFHVLSWMDVAHQWQHGVVFPRWAMLADYGYGEPRFIFYPPSSWLLGGALSFVLPWKIVPGVFVWLALTGAGAAMFFLARKWLSPSAAGLAALIYITNPYEIMLVYWRWAISELLVTALFPLLLLCALRMEQANRRDVILLALVYAGVWMTNAPGAVIATYSLAIMLFALALLGRSSRPLVLGVLALGLGLALAAFYIVPAIWEQHWVQIKNVLGPWVFLPQNNFVTVSPPRNRRFIATAAVNIGLALALAGSVLWRRRQWPRAWTALAVLLAAAVFLMLPFSDSLWRSLPELRFVQFPWRWLLAMNAVAVLFFAAVCAHAPRRTRMMMTATAMMLFCVMLGVARIKSGEPGKVERLARTVAATGYGGAPEYLPAQTEPHNGPGGAIFSSEGKSETLAVATVFRSGKILASPDVPRPGTLRFPVAWYPAWQAEANGAPVAVERENGLLAVPLRPGHNTIQLRFGRTPDRIFGSILTLVALIFSGLTLASPPRETGAAANIRKHAIHQRSL
jgi:hypothetical protein